MDRESNYESDLSDSWSLIDINLNEEEIDVAEATKLEKTPSQLTDVNLRKIKEGKHCNNKKETESNNLNNFDSDSFVKSLELSLSCKEESESVERTSDECKNDSDDTESIEILDLDGNDRDTDVEVLNISAPKFDDGTYHSDDEESSSGGSINKEIRSSNLTVIRKRRRKLSKHSGSSREDINSDYASRIKKNSRPNEGRDRKEEAEARLLECSTRPVYKHYRNNVANTVLSLSMGVIFAGVACIAIGHFLGVQDAAETVVELMEEIKKLQMESIALQSRLVHINRAFINQEMKLELPPKEPQSKISCIQSPRLEPTKIEQRGLNHEGNEFPLNAFNWLSEIKNLINQKRGGSSKETEEKEIDFEGIGRYIHDQLNFINDRIEEGTKLKRLEESDKRISKELNSILDKLSATQNSIRNLYHRVMKLRDKLKNKVNIVSNSVGSGAEIKILNQIPVREQDLCSFQWNPEKKQFSDVPSPFPLYKYPQPENYYKIKEEVKSIIERQPDVNRTGEIGKSVGGLSGTEKREGKRFKEKNKKRESKRMKDKKKEKKVREKKGDKKWKHAGRKLKKDITKDWEVKKEQALKSGDLKYNFDKVTVNETKYQSKKPSKVGNFKEKRKPRTKKNKKSKFLRVFLKNQETGSHLKDHYSWLCSGTGVPSRDPRCFNATGEWVFKWAGGREEFRRHQTVSDWLFERAKKRKELRDEDIEENWQFKRAGRRKELRDEDIEENWQFKRAGRRKELREDDLEDNWQFKRASARESNRDDRWHRGKYSGKTFLQDGYSWI